MRPRYKGPRPWATFQRIQACTELDLRCPVEGRLRNVDERFVMGGLTVAILALVAILVHREFSRPRQARPALPPPVFVAEWDAVASVAFPAAPDDAGVRVVEFIDLECPACRAYAPVMEKIRSRFGTRISVQYAHFPLSYHKFARTAALAAECAEALGRGSEFVRVALARQDQFGEVPWAVLATDAGIVDSAAFQRCVEMEARFGRVDAGVETGKRLGVNATPTLFVQGWRFERLPDEEELTEFIAKLLDGEVQRPSISSDSQAWHPARYRDDGILVMAFDSSTLGRVHQWRTQEKPVAEVGGTDESLDLTDVWDGVYLPDGRFVILSPRGPELRVFSPDGGRSKVLGRTGAGPGEWRAAARLAAAAGDSLVFIDPGNMRLNVVSAEDGGTRSENLAGRIPFGADRVVGMLDSAGVVVATLGRLATRAPSGRMRTDASILLLPPDDTARTLRTVPDVEIEVVETRYEGRFGTEPVPVGYGATTTAVTWGEYIVVGTGDAYRVDLYASTGAHVLSLEVLTSRMPVTESMRTVEVARRLDEFANYRERPIDSGESERLIRKMPFADSLPSVQGIFVSAGGLLWIVDTRIPASASWTATAFRLDGAMLGRLTSEAMGVPLAFGPDRVLLRSVDADGVVTIRSYLFETASRD